MLFIRDAMKSNSYKPLDSVINIISVQFGDRACDAIEHAEDQMREMRKWIDIGYVHLIGFVHVWDARSEKVIQVGLNISNN